MTSAIPAARVIPRAPYGFEELADDAAALIAALGYTRAHVFGTSFGGVIAQVLASRHPERIDRLVLSSTFRAGAPLPSINPGISAVCRTAQPPAGFGSGVRRILLHAQTISRPIRRRSSIFGGNKRTDEQKARRGAVIPRPISVDLGKITAPTLVLVGAEDRLIPPAHTLVAGSRDRERKDRDHPRRRPCRPPGKILRRSRRP